MPHGTSSSHRQFVVNILANVLSFAFSLAIGLWYTPFVIAHLGVLVYGLVPLATSITSYLSIITIAVSGSVGRFITMDVAREDYAAANRTFNTFLFSSLFFSIGLAILSLGFIWAAPRVLNVPAAQENQIRLLFSGVIGAFVIQMIANNFDASVWATNRFEIRSVLDIGALLLRVGTVVVFFSFFTPVLWHIGLAIFAGALLWSVGNIWAWKVLTPYLHVQFSAVDRARLPELFHTSRWLFLNQLGSILFMNMDLILVNLMVGVGAVGFYAPILQWLVLLRGFATTVGAVLAPSIVSFHARGDDASMARLARQSMKLLGLLFALPVGLLSGLSRPALETWLGPSFTPMAPLAWLVIPPLVIEAAVIPLGAILFAVNRVRVLAMVTLVGGAVNLLLAWLMVRQFHWGVYGVAAAAAAVALCRNAVFYPLYCAALTHTRRRGFLSELLKIGALTAAIALAAWFAAPLLPGRSWSHLALAAGTITVPALLAMYGLVIDPEDRQLLRKLWFQMVLKKTDHEL